MRESHDSIKTCKNYLWIYRGRGPALSHSHSHSLLSLTLSVGLFLSSSVTLSLYCTGKHITRGRGVDVVDFEVVRVVVAVVVSWDT
jgi:hypothetical protein